MASLVGVAVFSHPCNDAVLTGTFRGIQDKKDAVELGRFVLLDEVEGNGETWFLARAFAGLKREGLAGVVSYSDPVERRMSSGAVVFGGHFGTIYQAANARFLGRAEGRTLRVFEDGRVFHHRALQKIRQRERGWQHAAAQLVERGADEPTGDLVAWAKAWVERLTRPLRHPGNLKYAWAFSRGAEKMLPAGLPYLKKDGNQRWRDGQDSKRPDDRIDPRRYEVAPLDGDTVPKAFVERHHYSGTYPAARFRFGLYRIGAAS